MMSFPCGTCGKAVKNNQKAVCCDLCNLWVHLKCNNLDNKTYFILMNSTETWFCSKCTNEIIPFSTVNNDDLNSISNSFVEDYDTDTVDYLEKVNEYFSKINNNTNNHDVTQYFDIEKFNNAKVNDNSCSFLHLNISSLSYHFEELQQFLSLCTYNFDVICITESKIRFNKDTLTNISLPGFVIES
jgi:hypothetical protein